MWIGGSCMHVRVACARGMPAPTLTFAGGALAGWGLHGLWIMDACGPRMHARTHARACTCAWHARMGAFLLRAHRSCMHARHACPSLAHARTPRVPIARACTNARTHTTRTHSIHMCMACSHGHVLVACPSRTRMPITHAHTHSCCMPITHAHAHSCCMPIAHAHAHSCCMHITHARAHARAHTRTHTACGCCMHIHLELYNGGITRLKHNATPLE